MTIYGLILAGGRSQRFGTDKSGAMLAGVPLIEYAARILRDCASSLAVSGNSDAAAAVGATALQDPAGSPKGPLSGILSGLNWAGECNARWLVTIPCDAPLLPRDLPVCLVAAAEQANNSMAVARTSDGMQPLCAAWQLKLKAELTRALSGGVHPPVHQFATNIHATEVFFPDSERFLNINTQEELMRAERVLSGK